ncbi:hairy-related 2 [Chanos chanos]|uniref:Hairy-related 2 n=1 Tax=Chanos chanos TaxID=29144 RepID=A0A6J2VSH1_CHACN|nr:transcription factor HES-5-like [Chanos chanos]
MAPTNTCSLTKIAKDKIKLRKPVVEKMRRDRINISIEKLKLLLKRELKAVQPQGKVEKADILEMTVLYLRNNTQLPLTSNTSGQSYARGFSKCLEESLRFLSMHNQLKDKKAAFSSHREKQTEATRSTTKSIPVQPLWRPW